MQCISLYSIKGGVGKTASAVNLAYLAASSGRRVLLWDLDPQAASTFYLRIRPRQGGTRKLLAGKRDLDALIKASDYPRLHLLPARFSFRNADLAVARDARPLRLFRRLIEPLASAYDLVIFDCAPGLSIVSESVLAASTLALVPVIPTPLSVRTLAQLSDHLGTDTRPEIGPFFSMVDRRKRLHRDIVDAPEQLARPPLASAIPYASQVEQMGVKRAPLATFAPGCAAEKAYAALWNEVQGRLRSRADG